MLQRGLYRRGLAAASALLLIGCVQTSALPGQRGAAVSQHDLCRMAESDRRWLTDALGSWRIALRHFLKVDNHPLPQIIVYDERCSYSLPPQAQSGVRWSTTAHGGQVTLPNGRRMAAGPNAFNAVTSEVVNFVVMSLPSIWQQVAPPSEIPLGWFLEGIMLHELAHSYQSAVNPSASFVRLQREGLIPDNVSDDSVQEKFKENAIYVREYTAERDLLFRAASAPTDGEARALACEALALFRERRLRHFTGVNAQWAAVDEISLTTEGLGQWLSYAWLTRGRHLAPAVVLPKLRSSFWSQDEGLAIFLLVDRLVPNWQRLVLSSSPETTEQLLARACGR